MELTFEEGVAYVNENLDITADQIPDEYLDLWVPYKVSRPFEGIEVDELYAAFRAAYDPFDQFAYYDSAIECKYYNLFKYNLYNEKSKRQRGEKSKGVKIFDFSTYDLLFEIDPLVLRMINTPQYI